MKKNAIYKLVKYLFYFEVQKVFFLYLNNNKTVFYILINVK